MESRFRIRTRDGQEMAPRTIEAFSEMVRSGVVRPDDMVFDALTGAWTPAASHPMVLLFLDLQEHDPLTTGGAGDDFGLELTEPAEASPEAEAEAFIRRMDEERRHDQEVALSRELPLMDVRPSALAAAGLVPDPTEAGVTPVRARPRPVPPPAVVEAPTLEPPRMKRSPYRRGLRGLGLAAAAALVGALALWRPGAGPSAIGGTVAAVNAASLGGGALGAPAAAPGGRALTATEEEVRAEALDRYAEAVERVREQVGLRDAPEAWLEGRYLADPRAYPEVPRYWGLVRSFIEDAREKDEDLYREAYLGALGVAGPERSLRMARALEDFAKDAPRREEHYERVWKLASASLALHDLLIELDGRVTYEPIQGRRVSADPVLEAAGTDPEAQSLLEVALDRVLKQLPSSGGLPARDRRHLTEWMVGGVAR